MTASHVPPSRVVAFHVQASRTAGMGHLARSSAVVSGLREEGVETLFHLDADACGHEAARLRCLVPEPLPPPPAALVMDAVHLPDAVVTRAHDYFPRILLSPLCDHPEVASHVLVRDAPDALRVGLAPGAQLVTDPDFAFVTARGLRPRRRAFDRLCVGLCLSGGDDALDLDAIIAALMRAPRVSEVRVIDRRALALLPAGGPRLIHAPHVRDPWTFFDGINVFVGGDGVMLAEAIAQAIPALSLTTPDRLHKNRALIASGALLTAARAPFDVEALSGQLIDPGRLEAMHAAAWQLRGSERSGSLTRHVRAILEGSMP